MPDFDPITGEPLSPKQEPKPEEHSPSLMDRERKFVEREKREHPFLVKFFSMDNPLWTLIPILVSVTALYFAYRSTLISREATDVHLRVNALVISGYPVPAWNFQRDGKTFMPGVLGDQESLQKMIIENPVAVSINSLHMRWNAMASGVDIGRLNFENLPFTEEYHYLQISNDSDQIAENLTVSFKYYPEEDNETLRGRSFVPEGVQPQDWTFGPAPVAPRQVILVPIGTSYMRYDPSIDDPKDLYRYFDFQYFGEFYFPLKLTYTSSVSGEHEIPLDLNKIIPTAGAFNEPPKGPVGEQARAAVQEFESGLSENAENIVQNLAPEDAIGGGAGNDNQGNGQGTSGRGSKERRGN